MEHTEERISKILSAHGVCSRRTAEEWIEQGRVTVNGLAALLGQKADAGRDLICVDGKPIREKGALCYIMLHKPRGYVTTVSDEKGRRTVLDLLPKMSERLWPVGRLDMDSEGLLLLTNDGDLTNRLLHPRHEVPKTYEVWVAGNVRKAVPALREMCVLEGEAIARPEVRILRRDPAGGVLSVVIHEGKNRQVRRMCAAVGLQVKRLKRVQEGTVSLGDLPCGAWRYLEEAELEQLKHL